MCALDAELHMHPHDSGAQEKEKNGATEIKQDKSTCSIYASVCFLASCWSMIISFSKEL
jgi:hypothetical protein